MPSNTSFSRPNLRRNSAHVLLFVLAIAMPAAAAAAGECAAGNRPGATLLFPYFEVDLTGAENRTTLISIHNTSAETILTNVVLWTHCGLPALGFNLALEPHAVRPIDLQNLVTTGRIPFTGAGTLLPGCPTPVSDGFLEEEQLLSLHARLTGRPDPRDGLCYSTAPKPPTRAVGYVTVDVVKECSTVARTPHDPGYFAGEGAAGIADDANVLSGDFFLVDGAGDLAQGFEAVALVADPEIAESPRGGFYAMGDDRRPLGSRYRTRFFQGGAFDGGTELLVWVAPQYVRPFTCAYYDRCPVGGFSAFTAEVLARRESGERVVIDSMDLETTTARLRVGEEKRHHFDLSAIDARSGSLDLELYFHGCRSRKCTPPTKDLVQGWLMPIHTAEGRFSVGLNAVALDDSCID